MLKFAGTIFSKNQTSLNLVPANNSVLIRYSLAPSQWATTVWGASSPINQDISLKISGHSGVYLFRKGSLLMLYECFKEACDVWSFVEVAVTMRRWLPYPVSYHCAQELLCIHLLFAVSWSSSVVWCLLWVGLCSHLPRPLELLLTLLPKRIKLWIWWAPQNFHCHNQ